MRQTDTTEKKAYMNFVYAYLKRHDEILNGQDIEDLLAAPRGLVSFFEDDEHKKVHSGLTKPTAPLDPTIIKIQETFGIPILYNTFRDAFKANNENYTVFSDRKNIGSIITSNPLLALSPKRKPEDLKEGLYRRNEEQSEPQLSSDTQPEKPMIVLFTGMSGIEINSCLTKFIGEYREFKKDPTKKAILIKLDTELENVFYEANTSEPRTRQAWVNLILHKSYPHLEKYWKTAFSRILEKVNEIKRTNPGACIFVNLHSCYFHNKTQEYISLINIDELRKLEPKLIVTLIDDIYEIHHRLTKSGGIYHDEKNSSKTEMILRHLRLLDWRSKETMMSRFLANQLNCRNYVFAVKHSYETLYNLLYEDKKTAYLSHPITEVRRLEKLGKTKEAEQIKAEITDVSQELGFQFTTFLPTTIDEYRITTATQIQHKVGQGNIERRDYHAVLSSRWEDEKYKHPHEILYRPCEFSDENELWQKTPPETIDEEINQLLAALADVISDQVTTRDYTLVEQSDILVIYRPLFNGNASGGVQEEFHYYTMLQSDLENAPVCFIYCPQEDIDKYYIKEFNERITYHLIKTKNLSQSGDSFKGITERECAKLLEAGRLEGLILDVFIDVLDNHNLALSIVNTKTPLGRNNIADFKNTFVTELLKSYTVVDTYKNKATYFVNEKMTVSAFCSRINETFKTSSYGNEHIS